MASLPADWGAEAQLSSRLKISLIRSLAYVLSLWLIEKGLWGDMQKLGILLVCILIVAGSFSFFNFLNLFFLRKLSFLILQNNPSSDSLLSFLSLQLFPHPTTHSFLSKFTFFQRGDFLICKLEWFNSYCLLAGVSLLSSFWTPWRMFLMSL